MIYVDTLINYGWVLRGKRVESCHMLADTLEELHAMATKIGMKLSWFQMSTNGTPHYDLVKSRRDRAIVLGAKELNRKEVVEKMAEIRLKDEVIELNELYKLKGNNKTAK